MAFGCGIAERKVRRISGLVVALASLSLSACAGMGDYGLSSLGSSGGSAAHSETAAAGPDSRTELEKATEYWGKEYAKNEKSSQALLNYVRNLRALGQKQQALALLQQGSILHSGNREFLSEYGRAALEADQTSLALKLLEQADDSARPDWRVLNARGTALAKLNRYQEAVPILERAHLLAPTQASVANNLALAYTMDGQAAKAEPLLRKAAELQGADPRVRQNLALVLGLQGKHVEARTVSSQDLSPEQVNANGEFMRRMVKAQSGEAGEPGDAQSAVGNWVVESQVQSAIPAPAPRPARSQARQPHAAAGQQPARSSGGPALRPSSN